MTDITFEQLCVEDVTGYVYDKKCLLNFKCPSNFEEVAIKIITKCDASLLLLNSHKGSIEEFTVRILPVCSKLIVSKAQRGIKRKIKEVVVAHESDLIEIISNEWNLLEKDYGCHGLQVLSILDSFSLPLNSSKKYPLSLFAESLIHYINAYYMFQKPHDAFIYTRPDSLESLSDHYFMVFIAWKFSSDEAENFSALPTSVTSGPLKHSPIWSHEKDDSSAKMAKLNGTCSTRQRTKKEKKQGTYVEEEDNEISFKNKPNLTCYNPTSDEISKVENMMETSLIDVDGKIVNVEDVTFGFERSSKSPKVSGRKSSRKSILPEWPEEEKAFVLKIFDNLNPSQSEQTRIALTCKYGTLQYNRELPSKLLYQWVQQKGREMNTTVMNFELAKGEEKAAALEILKNLNVEQSQPSRISFVIKFIQAQYGINITSKQIYAWLNEKSKKVTKKK